MFKQFIGFAAAAAATFALAQAPEAPPASASSPDTAVKADKVDPVMGFMRERTPFITNHNDFCSQSSSALPARALVIVVRKAPCVTKYAKTTVDYLEVLYAGKPRLVLTESVFMSPEQQRKFDALQTGQAEANADEWQLVSLIATKKELEDALKAFDLAGKQGITLLTDSIFDVSEHTEGTGFRASVANTSKKMIKYVTFNVTGLNAVGDPVQGLGRSGGASTLRGIGPIEPGETATYSREYMWHTDLVEKYRINNIKLEFADGSSKVITDVKKIRLRSDHYEMMISTVD